MQHAFAKEMADPLDLAREEPRDTGRDGVDRHEPHRHEQAQAGPGRVEDVQVGRDRAAERDVPADHEESEYHEEVEQPFRDDDTDGARERDPEAALHEVAAVEVPELRRDQAVHKPTEHEDAQEIPPLDVGAALAQEARPPDRTDREREVIHAECRDDVERIRPAEGSERLGPVDVAREVRDEGQRDERRDELAPAEQLAPVGSST